jgi:hypothetical protein
MPPLMAAEVVGESSEDDETLADVGRLQPAVVVMDRILPSFWNTGWASCRVEARK